MDSLWSLYLFCLSVEKANKQTNKTKQKILQSGPKSLKNTTNKQTTKQANKQTPNILQEHIWKHNAPGAYRKYAPEAVCIQIMLLENIGLTRLLQIVYAPGACSWSSFSLRICSWSIILGQNLTEVFQFKWPVSL